MRRFTEESATAFVRNIWFGNGAGSCREAHHAIMLAQAGASVVTIGSFTMDQRDGNPGENYYHDEAAGWDINALGLPTKGFDRNKSWWPAGRKRVNALGARLSVSISAGDVFVPPEYYAMAKVIRDMDAADIIEGNFSCPNVVGTDGKRKPVVCFDKGSLRDGVRALREGAGHLPIAVKIAPITDGGLLEGIVDICNESRVEYLITANTLGGGYLTKADGSAAIAMGQGGLSGPNLRPIIKGMILTLRKIMDRKSVTQITALGGIEEGQHAYDYLALGASGCAFTSVLYRQNGDPKIVSDIAAGRDDQPKSPGLIELLVEKGLPIEE